MEQRLSRSIKSARAAEGLRQLDLAKRVRVPLWQISAIEAGYDFPARDEVLRKVARSLGITLQLAEAAKG